MPRPFVTQPAARPTLTVRRSERRRLQVAGRLTWRDNNGTLRFAGIRTVDVSEHGVRVEADSHHAIPLYRLVQLQLDRDPRQHDPVPPPLRDGRILAAVYRVGPIRRATGVPSEYALRLLVEPSVFRTAAGAPSEPDEQRSIA